MRLSLEIHDCTFAGNILNNWRNDSVDSVEMKRIFASFETSRVSDNNPFFSKLKFNWKKKLAKLPYVVLCWNAYSNVSKESDRWK